MKLRGQPRIVVLGALLLHEIERATIAAPVAIAEAALRPLRDLLGVPRAIVNVFDLAAGEAEWLAAIGRQRMVIEPGVRFSLALKGDVDALGRGEVQIVDVTAKPPGPEVDALRASGVDTYMVVPMIAGGELIGGLSFGGPRREFPEEQVSIAREVAGVLAIAIAQTRLNNASRRSSGRPRRRPQHARPGQSVLRRPAPCRPRVMGDLGCLRISSPRPIVLASGPWWIRTTSIVPRPSGPSSPRGREQCRASPSARPCSRRVDGRSRIRDHSVGHQDMYATIHRTMTPRT